MHRLVTVLILATLLGGVARAQPPTLPLVPEKDQEMAENARTLRATGIGLFVGGLVVSVGSLVLSAMAFAGGDERMNGPHAWTIAAASTVVAGNAMLATGLGLWGVGNHRLKLARGLAFVF
jgi:hypothetical protein